jgi:hypothetical protein
VGRARNRGLLRGRVEKPAFPSGWCGLGPVLYMGTAETLRLCGGRVKLGVSDVKRESESAKR